MQHLGRVLHFSSSRKLILQVEAPPKIGARVVDENLNFIGTVFDVFGPVSSPYVAVKPSTSTPQHLVGGTVYTVSPSKDRKEKRKHGR